MVVQEPVQAAIWHCLNHYAYPDAIFLAERLHAEVSTEESLFLLATCYYRSGRVRQAYALLIKNSPSSAQCRFLLAKCSFDLGKFAESEAALFDGYYKQTQNVDELNQVISNLGDLACFALQIIAKICYKKAQNAFGNEAHKQALKLNPFLWHSFEELCNVGEKVEPNKIFQIDKLDNFSMCHGSTVACNYTSDLDFIITPSGNLASTPIQNNNLTSTPAVIGNGIPNLRLIVPQEESPSLGSHLNNCQTSPRGKPSKYRSIFSNSLSPLTPTFGILPLDLNVTPEPASLPSHATLTEANDQKSLSKRQLISRKETPLQQGKPVFSQTSNTSNTANIVAVTPTAPPSPAPTLQGQNVRRSSRLFSHSVKENNKSPHRNKFTTPKSPSRKTKARLTKTNLNKNNFKDLNEKIRNEKEKSETITSEKAIANTNALNQTNSPKCVLTLQKQCAEGLMSLLRELGTAYQNLTQFNCKKAVEILNNLPEQHYNTGWVLSMLAKAHFEMIDYKKSASYFAKVRTLEPQRTDLMEIYSTVLWHLHSEVELSTLAQELVSEDRNSAAAWCATGNLFSAQTEHETAIKFFQRAIQVDPNFPYAYTLLGHEYVLTEELEKAITAFRHAVRLDSRHYNAWFGLGTIFSKQEQYTLAELHFNKALLINPHNSAIMCHIGVVQHALKRVDDALKTLNMALEKDPNNTLCKFHRASINFSIGRNAEALKEFEELKNIVPKESLVYYSIGKVHKKLGNTHLALMYFSWATDLDPKGAHSQIKEAILSPGHGDDEPPIAHSEEQAQNCSLEQEEEVSGETSGNASRLGGEIMEREVHNVDDSDDSL